MYFRNPRQALSRTVVQHRGRNRREHGRGERVVLEQRFDLARRRRGLLVLAGARVCQHDSGYVRNGRSGRETRSLLRNVEVPEGVNIQEYDSVLVWCEAFSEFITAATYR